MKSPEDLAIQATKTVALSMLSAKVVQEPVLAFLRDADALTDAYLQALHNNDGLRSALSGNRQRYLLVLAYHAFGAGAYVGANYEDDAGFDDLQRGGTQRILTDLLRKGSLEVGLQALSVRPDSTNKKVLDQIMLSSVSDLYNDFKKELGGREHGDLELAMMRVYFNAGVTVALLRRPPSEG